MFGGVSKELMSRLREALVTASFGSRYWTMNGSWKGVVGILVPRMREVVK